jgi:MULE transposase domain
MSLSSIPNPLQLDFESLQAARSAVRSYIVERGESYQVTHSNAQQQILACRDGACKFRVRIVALKGPKYQVTQFIPYTCSPATHQGFREANSVTLLVACHRANVADNREVQPCQIQSTERIQYGNAGVSYQQAWRTREALQEELEGNEAESFKRFPALMDLWRAANSENYGALSTIDNRFQYCFIAPAVIRAAFETCRPLIALDGYHTKSRYRMTLLVASMVDGNNEILPITWAMVPIEDADNWIWFLEQMDQCFYQIKEDMVMISDRDKRLVAAVSKVFLLVHHSHCSQHLADNVQKNFGMVCRNLFWGVANAYTEHAFVKAMAKIRSEKEDAYKYLNKISHSSWSQYVFLVPRFGHITSNIAESVNSS